MMLWRFSGALGRRGEALIRNFNETHANGSVGLWRKL
jgi:hypothetical protein